MTYVLLKSHNSFVWETEEKLKAHYATFGALAVNK